jgi:hypothetical protein
MGCVAFRDQVSECNMITMAVLKRSIQKWLRFFETGNLPGDGSPSQSNVHVDQVGNHFSTVHENGFGMPYRNLIYQQPPCTLSAIYALTNCSWWRHCNKMAVHCMTNPFTVNLKVTTQMKTMNSLLLYSLMMRTHFILLVMRNITCPNFEF